MKKKQRSSEYARASVRHSVELERYAPHVVKKMLSLLVRTEEDLIERIKALDPDSRSRTALEQRLEAIKEQQEASAKLLKERLLQELGDFAEYEAKFTKDLASAALGIAWQGVTKEQVRAAAMSRPFQGVHLKFATFEDQADEFGRRTGALVRDTIRKGFLEGRGVDAIVRELRGTRAQNYQDGILEGSRRGVEMITRTALNHTANAAREEVYKVNAASIKHVQWISVIDGRTSAICRARDGEFFEVDKGPRPPGHPNCRSTTISVFKGDEPIERVSYSDWLKGQERSTVENILGTRKAGLFLDGELTLDRFVNETGKEYSLEQLQQAEQHAWKKSS